MGDLWAPAREILVNGKPLPTGYDALIEGVKVEATTDGADELTISAVAWDSVARKFRFIGEDLLAAGNMVVVRAGYGSDLRALQRFRLVREEASYPENGAPTVTIRGYSAEARLAEYVAPRAYEGPISDSEIVELIAEEHGLTVTGTSIEATDPRDDGRAKAQGTSDLQFLQQLAVANGYGPPRVEYDEDTDSDVLIFRTTSLENQEEQATFRYNPTGSEAGSGTCLSFSPTLSLVGCPTRLEVVGYDPTAQAAIRVVIEVTAAGQETTVSTVDEIAELSEAIRSGSQLYVAVLDSSGMEDEKREAVTVYSVKTDVDALEWAKRWWKTRNEAFMTARARVVGWEALWVGQIHRFEGLAEHHNGLWEVQAVVHALDREGYSCDLDLSRVLDAAEEPTEV